MRTEKMFEEISNIKGFQGAIIQYTVTIHFHCKKSNVDNNMTNTIKYICRSNEIYDNVEFDGDLFLFDEYRTDDFNINFNIYTTSLDLPYIASKSRKVVEDFKKHYKNKYSEITYNDYVSDINTLTLEDLTEISTDHFKYIIKNLKEQSKNVN